MKHIIFMTEPAEEPKPNECDSFHLRVETDDIFIDESYTEKGPYVVAIAHKNRPINPKLKEYLESLPVGNALNSDGFFEVLNQLES